MRIGSVGWRNITLRNCVFEATDSEAADFSDSPTSRANGVLITGCTFKGGGVAQRHWGNVINFEYPTGVVVRNNTIERGWDNALGMTDRGVSGYSGPAATFTGNTFDLVTDNGVTPLGEDQVALMGSNNVFTGNTIIVNTGNRAIQLDNCHYNTVTGNTIHMKAGMTAVGQIHGSSNNTTTPNTVN